MIYQLTITQYQTFEEMFPGMAYEDNGSYFIASSYLNIIPKGDLKEFCQNIMGLNPNEAFPNYHLLDDRAAEKMNLKKAKLANLFNALELNPFIDDGIGRRLLRRKSTFVESYKYSDQGYNDLMTELTEYSQLNTAMVNEQMEEEINFLNGETQPGSGITVLIAIGGLLS